MAEDFEIKLRATGADKAAKEVKKAGDATKEAAKQSQGFSGQTYNSEDAVRGLDDALGRTERTIHDAADAMEELAVIQRELNELTDAGSEANQKAARERKRQAEDDVDRLQRQRDAQEEALSRRQRVAATALAGASFLLSGYSDQFKSYAKSMAEINGETEKAAKSVQNLGVQTKDFADFSTNVLAGFAAGGPVGAIAGAVKGAVDLVLSGTKRAGEAVRKTRHELAKHVDSLQDVIAAERERERISNNQKIEKNYRDRVFLINEELRALQDLLRLEAIRDGGEADRAAIQDREARRQLALREGPASEIATEEQILDIRKKGLALVDQKAELQRKLTEELGDQKAQLDAIEAKEIQLIALAEQRRQLLPDSELPRLTKETSQLTKKDRNRVLAQDQAAVDAGREAQGNAEKGVFQELVELKRELGPIESEINAIRTELQEYSKTAEADLTQVFRTGIDTVVAAATEEATNRTQEIVNGPLREIFAAPREELDRATAQARADVEQVLADGKVLESERGKVVTAFQLLAQSIDSVYDELVKQGTVSQQLSTQQYQAIQTATQALSALSTKTATQERKLETVLMKIQTLRQ